MIGLLGFMFLPFVFRWLARLAAWTIGVIVAVMAAPVTVVTVTGLAVAWSRGLAAGPAAPGRRLVPADDRHLARGHRHHHPVARRQ